MSRASSDKKPVGFGTHITAGGLAGAMEAVRHPSAYLQAVFAHQSRNTAMLPTARHHQGAHAALQIWPSPRGMCPIPLRCAMRVCSSEAQTKARGFLATGAMIVRRETPLALYKGLGAVLSGIVPKMATRFASFETYKRWLADPESGKTSIGNIFLGAFIPIPSSRIYLYLFSGFCHR
jgi:solute carrier family 25 citrate transporter 1